MCGKQDALQNAISALVSTGQHWSVLVRLSLFRICTVSTHRGPRVFLMDPTNCPIHGWQLADQSLEAQVAQVVAGNLSAPGVDMGDDDVLVDVMNATCLWILLSSIWPRRIDSTLASQLSVEEVKHIAFGKPLPNKGTEWYPYKSKMVCPASPVK